MWQPSSRFALAVPSPSVLQPASGLPLNLWLQQRCRELEELLHLSDTESGPHSLRHAAGEDPSILCRSRMPTGPRSCRINIRHTTHLQHERLQVSANGVLKLE